MSQRGRETDRGGILRHSEQLYGRARVLRRGARRKGDTEANPEASGLCHEGRYLVCNLALARVRPAML